ncbi:hypothetical protein B0H13DRAFT_609681 [Mycena leptocephala]|nr:hypothetical protein B0H13DRAFT_609681 [Mycena leptocephala]
MLRTSQTLLASALGRVGGAFSFLLRSLLFFLCVPSFRRRILLYSSRRRSKRPGVYMHISFFGNTFNFFFPTRVLHNGCSWRLALLADDSWVVWALELEEGWRFDGDSILLFLAHFLLFSPRSRERVRAGISPSWR